MTSTNPTVPDEGQGDDNQRRATGRDRHRAHASATASCPGSLPICATITSQTRDPVDRARRGAANRRRGADAERAVAGWLRAHGWSHAERAVRTGYSGTGRLVVDPGDIVGTPALVWQIKDQARESVTAWLAETETQRVGSPGSTAADLGLLVVRRRGKADPGRWWVWLPADRLVALVAGPPIPHAPSPVRMELADLVALLRAAGYGEPLDGVDR